LFSISFLRDTETRLHDLFKFAHPEKSLIKFEFTEVQHYVGQGVSVSVVKVPAVVDVCKGQ